MKFVPYTYEKKYLEELKELCPINTFKVVDPSQLPIHSLPSDLVNKSIRVVVCGSGSTVGITTVVYMINFIRPDEKVLADLLISIKQARELHSGRMIPSKKRKKKDARQKFITLLSKRIKSLKGTKQLYEQNSNLAKNVKIANIELVQNEIEAIEELLNSTH